MDWKELGESIAKIGLPLLGAALPIPGGAAIGEALAGRIGASSSSPTDIFAKLTASADAIEKAKEFQLTHEETLLKIKVDYEVKLRQADSEDVENINKSITAEASSEHWPQYSWRPYNGFLYGTTVFLIYFVMPLLDKPVPNVPEWVWIGWGAILGVTAWHRGKAQSDKVGPVG